MKITEEFKKRFLGNENAGKPIAMPIMKKIKMIFIYEDGKCNAPILYDIEENKEITFITHLSITNNYITITRLKTVEGSKVEKGKMIEETFVGELHEVIHTIKNHEL